MTFQLKKNKIVKQLSLLSFFVFSISLLLPENFRNTSTIILALILLISINIKKGSKDFKEIKKTVLINTFFLIFIFFSLTYTNDIDYGLKRVLAMLPILIIPFSFSKLHEQIDFNKISQKLYKLFFISTVLFFVGVLIQNYFNEHLNEFIFRDYSERLNSKYGKYSMHPIYASLYLSISIILAIPLYTKLKLNKHRFLLLSGSFFLLLILLLLARKSIIALTFFIFALYITSILKSKKSILYFIITVVFFALVSFFIPSVRARYLELFSFLIDDNFQLGSTSIRLDIYKCSLESIKGQFLFGYGIGDVKQLLHQCYLDHDNLFNGKYYNSHNQYINVWLSSGIIGFISLIAMLGYNFKKAIKTKDFLYLAILILFSGVMLIENILERQNGVLLFSFFINFFAFKNLQQSKR